MVDWSLAQQPDIVGNALKYRAAGQQAAESAYDRNALMQKNQAAELERTRIATLRKDALGQYARGDAAGARNTAIQGDQLDLVDALTKLDGPAREAAKERAKVSGSILASWKALPAEQREGAKASLAPRLLSQGWSQEEIAGLPTDDAGIQSGLSMALTADQILSQQNNERDFGLKRDDLTADNRRSDMLASETVRNNQFQNGIAAGNLGVARGNLAMRGQEVSNQGEGVSKATRATEANLRKEFNGLQDVKNYRIVATQANAVKRLANAPPSAQNDIAQIYATMKAYDPTSVVRETEFATAQNAAGVPEQVRNQWNKVLSGQRLNPKQRQEMAQTVAGFADTYKQRYDTIANEYRGYASDYSGDPDRVVPLAAQEPAQAAPSGARAGANGKYYIADPNKPGSFPEARKAPDGFYYIRSANGKFLRVK